ncbi:MFS family permease [Bradyrhizobium diazoefficiens]
MASEIQTRVLRKITWRIVPFIMLLYFVAFIDRVNIGFASLTMNKDIGLSPAVYGFGAGIFFWGYFLFEVPSNIILHKIGARIWIARVMITWGIVSAAMAFVQGPTGFYILRFLLGVAEAGFFPGIILYLSYWFPARQRAAVTALFMARSPPCWARRYQVRCWRWTACSASRAGNGCSCWRRCRPCCSASSCSAS